MGRCNFCGNVEAFNRDQEQTTCSQSSCHACRALDSLDQEISDAKAHMDRLMKRREEMQYKVDALHKPIIDRLPVELAQYIFELCVEYPLNDPNADNARQYRRPQLRLGAVCRNWRRIAWSTHRLWTTIAFFYGPDTQESHVWLAIEWLSRSGQLPLLIFVGASETDLVLQAEIVDPLMDAIIQCSYRWDTLCLNLLAPLMLPHFVDAHAAPALRRLIVFSESDIEEFGTIEAMPSVVEIDYIALDSFRFQWNNLTHITTGAMDINEFLDILSLAPRLEICLLSEFGICDSSPIRTRPSAIVHHCLSIVRIESYYNADDCGLFFSQVIWPALTKFSLISAAETLPIGPALLSFFERSSPPLGLLYLSDIDTTGDELIQITNKLPSIEVLHLYPPTGGDPLAWNSFFCALSQTPIADDQQLPVFKLPLLPRLIDFKYIGGTFFPWHIISGLSFPSSQAIVGQDICRRPLKHICFIVYRHIPIIQRRILYQLLDLCEEGIDVFIAAKSLNDTADRFRLSFAKVRQDLEVERDWSVALSEPTNIFHFWERWPAEPSDSDSESQYYPVSGV